MGAERRPDDGVLAPGAGQPLAASEPLARTVTGPSQPPAAGEPLERTAPGVEVVTAQPSLQADTTVSEPPEMPDDEEVEELDFSVPASLLAAAAREPAQMPAFELGSGAAMSTRSSPPLRRSPVLPFLHAGPANGKTTGGFDATPPPLPPVAAQQPVPSEPSGPEVIYPPRVPAEDFVVEDRQPEPAIPATVQAMESRGAEPVLPPTVQSSPVRPELAQPAAAARPAAQPAVSAIPKTGEAPILASPRPARRRIFGLPLGALIGIAAGALGLIAGAIVAIVLLAGGDRPGEIQLDPHSLPPTTLAIRAGSITPAEITDPAIRKLQLAALFGRQFCDPGGRNPFSAIKFSSLSRISAALSDERLKKLRGALACGDLLAAARQSDLVTSISFKDEDKNHHVRAMRLPLDRLPSSFGWSARAFAGLAGFCWAPEGKECGAESPAVLFRDGTTYWATSAAMTYFARYLAKPVEQLNSTVDALMVAARHNTGLAQRSLEGNPESLKGALMNLCRFGVQLSGWKVDRKTCFPLELERRLEIHDASLRAVSFDRPATLAGASALRLGVTLVAKDEAAAERLAADLQEFARDWRSHLVNNEAKLLKTVETDPKKNAARMWRALASGYIRGMKAMEIERSGRAVTVAVDEDLTDAERREAAEVSQKASDADLQAAQLLEAVRTGAPISGKLLARITTKAAGKQLERIAKSAGRYFQRQRYDRRARRLPRSFPASSDGWVDSKSCCQDSPWYDLRLLPSDLALYRWRVMSEGTGTTARFTIEARMDHDGDSHTTHKLTATVDDDLHVALGEVVTTSK